MNNLFNILIEENKQFNNDKLAEFIEFIKNSGKIDIIKDVFSDVKENYFINDKIHGISHNERVVILATYIGIKEGLSDNELKLLANSALYHDIGRKNREENANHGEKSANLIEENKGEIFPNLNEEEINIIKTLSICHSHDDEQMQEIAQKSGVKDMTSFIKIAQILKDADALDRVRLPRFGKLDVNYLRTNTSKQIIDIAEELYFEAISVDNIQEDRKLNTRLEDEKYIYLFRALTETNIEDRNNGIKEIRPNSVREYEQTGEWKEYDSNSELSIEELYKHIRMQYKHCYTNCISLTEDPNVTLTYNPKIKSYVMVKVPKDASESKIYDAREYFISELKKVIEKTDLTGENETREVFGQIEKARSNEELRKVLKDFNVNLPTYFINDRQYLKLTEELDYHKTIAKLKVLEHNNLIGNIIEGIENDSLYSAMGNAFTSAEYIHYGTIEEEHIVECDKLFMDLYALLGQAKANGTDENTISRLTNKIIELSEKGINLSDEDRRIIEKDYTSKKSMNDDLTIKQAYELTNGQISYVETRMQITAARALAETEIKKRILIDYLKKNLPEETNIEEILKDTYCVNSEFSLKQNGRGHQLSNSVNVTVTDSGFDLENKHIKNLINNISNFTKEELEDIYINGVNSKTLKELMVITRANEERIKQYKSKGIETHYIAEAIIEGDDWKKTRGALTKKEKEKLAKTITSNVKKGDLEELYNNLQGINIGEQKLSQEEIFAAIINIAIDGKLGGISYKEVIALPKEEQKRLIEENSENIHTIINPISLDLLMGRGKTIKNLKQSLIEMGIEEEFLEEKDIRNIYTAKEIVEGYEWEQSIGRKIEKEEKGAIIQSILNHKHLNRKKAYLLSNLIEKLNKMDIEKQTISGIIINLGVNGTLKNRERCDYSFLLGGQTSINNIELIEKDGIIDEFTILKAKEKTIGKKSKEIRQSVIDLGIEEEFIEGKNIKNIYIAKEIVEGYNWEQAIGRKIKKEEKGEIIKAILNTNDLNTGKSLLSTLIEVLDETNITIQEMQGVIINLGINRGLKSKAGCGYTALLKGEINIAEIELLQEDKVITKETLLKVSKKEQEDLKQSLKEMGIEEEFIEEKDIRNIYTAKEIVEGYDWEQSIGRKIEKEEKGAIIRDILNNRNSETEHICLLNSLIERLIEEGNTLNEARGIIMNLAIKGKLNKSNECNYTGIQRGEIDVGELEFESEDKMISEATILKARENLNKKNKDNIIDALVKMGGEKEFLEDKDVRNIYIAKEIVEEYDWNKTIGREIIGEEKIKIIQSILNNNDLGGENPSLLSGLMSKLSKNGNTIQEIQGIIINLAINGCLKNKSGYGYSRMLNGGASLDKVEMLQEDLSVSKGTLLKVSKKEQENLKKSLIEMGIEEEFLEEKDIRNIYTAKEIVEGYYWEQSIGRNIENEEKGVIIQAILNHKNLGKERTYLLDNLIEKLNKKGLGKQEISSIIINLGVTGGLKDRKGCDYSSLLGGQTNIDEIEVIEEDTEINEVTILKAKEKTIEKKENKIKKSLIEMGIEEEFLEGKDIRNIYTAKEIVEGYNWKDGIGRKIENEEKTVIIKSILSTNILNKGKYIFLSTLMDKLIKKESSIQTIRGVVMNLGINGGINNRKGYGYTSILNGTINIAEIELLQEDKVVTEETILKAKQKSEQVMKKALKKTKESGEITEIESTLIGMQELIPNKDKKQQKVE